MNSCSLFFKCLATVFQPLSHLDIHLLWSNPSANHCYPFTILGYNVFFSETTLYSFWNHPILFLLTFVILFSFFHHYLQLLFCFSFFLLSLLWSFYLLFFCSFAHHWDPMNLTSSHVSVNHIPIYMPYYSLSPHYRINYVPQSKFIYLSPNFIYFRMWLYVNTGSLKR